MEEESKYIKYTFSPSPPPFKKEVRELQGNDMAIQTPNFCTS